MTRPTLCEVRKSEGHDNGCEGALACTDDLAHVDRNLAVRRLGRHDGPVGAHGGVRESSKKELAE